MAKFVMEDGKTASYDKLVREMRNGKAEASPTVSPILVTELRMIETLKEISKNLNDPTLDNSCIMQLIKGEKCECRIEGKDCNKCICLWYMGKE